jgi:uncharacterized protein YqjF (DUF2071 family)
MARAMRRHVRDFRRREPGGSTSRYASAQMDANVASAAPGNRSRLQMKDAAVTNDTPQEGTHRPWPAPHTPWVFAQTWSALLFAHWPVPTAQLRAMLPPDLALDTYDGEAWVGIVPFHLRRLAPRGAPDRLGLSFLELNVRTYVTLGDKPGVWFFSLDAASLPAVIGARATFHLPYFWAGMRLWDDAGWISYASRRRHPRAPAAEFVGRYRPVGPVSMAVTGSLEHWLTARYCLYAANRAGRIFRGEIDHPPWPLQAAEAEISVNTMAAPSGIVLTGPPLLHFSRNLEVATWPLQPARV